jgi:hypothetical protein
MSDTFLAGEFLAARDRGLEHADRTSQLHVLVL